MWIIDVKFGFRCKLEELSVAVWDADNLILWASIGCEVTGHI